MNEPMPVDPMLVEPMLVPVGSFFFLIILFNIIIIYRKHLVKTPSEPSPMPYKLQNYVMLPASLVSHVAGMAAMPLRPLWIFLKESNRKMSTLLF